MKKLILIIGIGCLVSAGANAQDVNVTTSQQGKTVVTTSGNNATAVVHRRARRRDESRYSSDRNIYPADAPNTDNKNLNRNNKIDKAPTSTDKRIMEQPVNEK
jgi:hypothetical protein